MQPKIQPSEGLREIFTKECEKKCETIFIWFGLNPNKNCVQKCVENTIKRERPYIKPP